MPILLLLHYLGPSIAEGTTVVVTTDNEANSFALNSGAAGPGPMRLLAPILLTAARHRLRIVADWIPRALNTLADALSRLVLMPGSRPWDASIEAFFRHALTRSDHSA